MTPRDLYNDPSKIAWHDPIVIDFETYYDKDYSLRKITTEKYIRCEQFECIGVSVKHGARPTDFFPRETGIDYIRRLIAANPASPVVMHNASFDAGILAFRYDIHPNFTVDTSIMAKLCGLDRVAGGVSLAKITGFLAERGILHTVKGTEVHNMAGVHAADMTYEQWQAYGDYCKLDVELAYGSYMHMLDKVPTSELIMADITTKMWTKPMIDLDVPLLKDYAVRLDNEREQMLSRIRGDLGFPTNEALLKSLRSSKKFVAILDCLGVEVPMKWSEKQEKMIPAVSKTDIEFLELLEHDDELVRTLVETKLGTMSSMEQTRTATFLDIASRGRMPIPLRYSGTHTHRFSGMDSLNLQNLTARGKEPVLRKSLRAVPNHIIMAIDASQVELRLSAIVANQQDLIALFVDGRDPYVDMAASIAGKSYEELFDISKINPTHEGKMLRQLGKACCLGLGYGASATKFGNLLELQGLAEHKEKAPDLVRVYRAKNNMLVHAWKICGQVLDVMYAGGSMWFGGVDNDLFFADGTSEFHGKKIPSIRLPNGTYIFYQNLRKEVGDDGKLNFVYDQFKGRNWLPKRIFSSALFENLIQALSFCVLKWQAIEMAKQGVPINLNVHDEWVSVVPRKQAPQMAVAMYKAMKSAPDYIPRGLLDCELDIGHCYGDLHTIDVAKALGD